MKKYPKYKDSGIEWIGIVPKHWQLKRVDWEFDYLKSVISKSDFKNEEVFYYSIPSIQLHGDGLYENGDNIDSNKILLNGNELLISKLNPRKETIILTEPKKIKIIGSTEFIPLVTNTCNKKFSYYLFLSHQTKEQICACVQSVTKSHQRARPEDIMKMWNIFPPYDEQKQIANYLDQKTKQIDTLIEKKQKLIELLKEKRSAIINQAVTKGLDPNVPMKDSGIEWLGEIPEHWKIKRIKYLLKAQKGALKTGPFGSQLKNSELDVNGKIKVYNQRNVLDIDFESGDEFINEIKFNELKDFEIQEDDILITSRGTIGKCAIFPKGKQKGVLHPCLIRMQINQKIALNEWVIAYINESSYFNENVLLNSNATTIDVIYGNTLREVVIPTPPRDEQRIILDYIFKAVNNVNEAINNNDQLIEKLKEYRTTLISEVVTGKIDVRNEVKK